MVCIWLASCATCGTAPLQRGTGRRSHRAATVRCGAERSPAEGAAPDRDQVRPGARPARGGRAAPVPAVRTPRADAGQAGRREARRMQQKPASISPRAKASACTSPVASIRSSITCGIRSRKPRTHCGNRCNPRWIQMPANRRQEHHRGRRPRPQPLHVLRHGLQESDFGKPMIGVANGHSTITPCNSRPAKAGRRGRRRPRGGRRQCPGVRHAHHQRRHGHGHRGHEVFAWSAAR
jgi:hypothetical protein